MAGPDFPPIQSLRIAVRPAIHFQKRRGTKQLSIPLDKAQVESQ
jgi:hypothetical protein